MIQMKTKEKKKVQSYMQRETKKKRKEETRKVFIHDDIFFASAHKKISS
jgi:LDH2 family malate/lactate/ureidoglycolate dehydrogenase